MRQFMAAVTQKLDDLQKVPPPIVESLRSSVDFMSAKYDEMLQVQREDHQKLIAVETQVAALTSQLSGRGQEIKDLQYRLMCAEQYSRNTNLEFAGIAVTEGENLKEIMMKIAETISEPWDPSDIDVIHRLPTRQQGATPKIVAQFVSRTKRDRWLQKRKIKFMSKDIVNTNSTERVNISEHLSDQWMHLLWKAKKVGTVDPKVISTFGSTRTSSWQKKGRKIGYLFRYQVRMTLASLSE